MTKAPDRSGDDLSIFSVSSAWAEAYPEAHAGVLVMRGAANPARHAGLDQEKANLEKSLRERYAGMNRGQLLEDPILRAYDAHYRRFKKTYHVQLQLESILFKQKAIPSVAALVEAMFMAEVETRLLTAGHDLDRIQLPLTLDVATGSESYVLLRGEPQATKSGDMLIHDRLGIVSSIVYGPDQRTQINANTSKAVFTVYAPNGVPVTAIEAHLDKIQQYVKMISPEAYPSLARVYGEAEGSAPG